MKTKVKVLSITLINILILSIFIGLYIFIRSETINNNLAITSNDVLKKFNEVNKEENIYNVNENYGFNNFNRDGTLANGGGLFNFFGVSTWDNKEKEINSKLIILRTLFIHPINATFVSPIITSLKIGKATKSELNKEDFIADILDSDAVIPTSKNDPSNKNWNTNTNRNWNTSFGKISTSYNAFIDKKINSGYKAYVGNKISEDHLVRIPKDIINSSYVHMFTNERNYFSFFPFSIINDDPAIKIPGNWIVLSKSDTTNINKKNGNNTAADAIDWEKYLNNDNVYFLKE